ncbi:MAG: metallophosphoesterase family protein [Thermodesulfobacteriota bacterium]
MILKILHTSDIHIGMTFSSRGYLESLRKQLIEARFEAVERMVKKANEEKCDLLVIAGDLFDRANVKKVDIERTAKILSSFTGKCVAVLPGNHDFYDGTVDLWKNFQENAPDNTILLLETKPYPLEELDINAVLYPAPCNSKHSEEHNLGWLHKLEKRPKAKWHIGIAHGALSGVCPDFNGRYYNMDEQNLRDLGLDLWFLGHSHVRYPDIDEFNDSKVIYSGTPEPDGFDCDHCGYACLITLEDTGLLRGKSVSTGKFRFKEIQKVVSSKHDLEKLKSELTSSNSDNLLVKLKMSGRLAREEFESRQKIYDEIRGSILHLDIDDSHLELEITQEVIDKEFTKGSLPYRILNNLAKAGDKQALQIAYELIKEVRK